MTATRGPRINLSLLLAAGLGLAVALSVAGMAAVAAWNGVEARSDAVRRTAGLFMRNMEMVLAQHMRAAEHQTGHVARMLSDGELDPAQGEEFVRLLRASLAAAPQVVSIGYVSPSLETVQVERRGTGFAVVRGNLRNEAEGLPLRRAAMSGAGNGRPLTPEQRDSGAVKGRWGGVTWHPALRQATLTWHAPLPPDSRVGGAVFAAISVSALSRFLGGLDESTGATSFLLYDHDKVLAHPRLVSETYGWLGGDRPLAAASELGDPVLAAAAVHGRGGRSLLQAVVADAGGRRIRAGGGDYVYFSKQITGFADKPLRLGIFVPSARFMDELERLKGFLLIAAGFVVIGMLIAWRAGRWLAKPAREVATGAGRVSTLDLREVREIPPIWVSELNDAAHAFNRMLFALRWF
ncbi:MAG: hypothetical protein ACLFWF_14260, partial [Alphaproteobacteria bacterium]